ncbi:hypothetical protein GCM10007079_13080 [Nocardiopsis terrae]|uniref:DUF5941 domain-containing protein n=1 Tax=Nocardiopsis terrae TaxID=372655 RepID=A0ABR9HBT4_9ACTN|nr:DUF5941 domain-containing protein [Nocardiopsis terrae]MBE1456484.1 hypothetical protein [Nocardiopsis terrae]GHC76616.1 hypothetical protein GCM10007079_13080 [Nocardiopsis terrae]
MSTAEPGRDPGHDRERLEPVLPDLRFLRDDSHIGILLGRIAPGMAPPLLTAVAGAVVVLVLLAAGGGRLTGINLFAPVAALLLSGLASGHPHDGRYDWLVPPVLRVTEYGCLAVVGLASGVPGPLVFVLLMTVGCHHRDDVARPAVGVSRPAWVRRAALGWDGRMLVIAVGGAFSALTPAYGILAGYLAVLLVREAGRTWSATPVTDVRVGAATPSGGAVLGDHPITRQGDGGRPAAGTNGEA